MLPFPQAFAHLSDAFVAIDVQMRILAAGWSPELTVEVGEESLLRNTRPPRLVLCPTIGDFAKGAFKNIGATEGAANQGPLTPPTGHFIDTHTMSVEVHIWGDELKTDPIIGKEKVRGYNRCEDILNLLVQTLRGENSLALGASRMLRSKWNPAGFTTGGRELIVWFSIDRPMADAPSKSATIAEIIARPELIAGSQSTDGIPTQLPVPFP